MPSRTKQVKEDGMVVEATYDRSVQDVGNILLMEHVNVLVPEQQTAINFYISGLGLTRDPYMMVGQDNLWANAGKQQFHLPTRGQQVLRGHIGMEMQDMDGLKARLAAVKPLLENTQYAYYLEGDAVAVTGPWGNKFLCRQGTTDGNEMPVGIRYVEFTVPMGTAPGIARFYNEIIQAPALVKDEAAGNVARVRMGLSQELRFRETSAALAPYDGHHIALYISNFSGPHAFLKERGLITEETNDYQYRFQDIIDLDTGEKLFEIEHEVRSATHPMFQRPLVNRNPAQNLQNYLFGRDALVL
jgi:hypothetical protein